MPVPKRYSRAQVALHWIIATLIILQLVINEAMQDAFKDRLAGMPSEAMGGAIWHAAVGLIILALAFVRLYLRVFRGVPTMAEDTPVLIKLTGLYTHWLLYAFIFGMPITGAIAFFFGVESSAAIHEFGRLLLIPIIALHVGGAFVEHFVFRSDALLRMMRIAPRR